MKILRRGGNINTQLDAISELYKKKEKVEEDIAKVLKEFYEDTGFVVDEKIEAVFYSDEFSYDVRVRITL